MDNSKKKISKLNLVTLSKKSLDSHIFEQNSASILIFYKKSCQTSIYLIKHLIHFWGRLNSDLQIILLISQDSLSETQLFCSSNKIPFQIALDYDNFRFSRMMGFKTVPACYLVNSSGKILKRTFGFERKELIDMFDILLRLNNYPFQPLFENENKIPKTKPG